MSNRAEPMMVKDLVRVLLNCDPNALVFVDEEGCVVNLYESNIEIDKDGSIIL